MSGKAGLRVKFYLVRSDDRFDTPGDGYILSPDPVVARTHERDGKTGKVWASYHDCRGWIQVRARAWHALGGTWLPRGGGPVRISLEIKTKKVRT